LKGFLLRLLLLGTLSALAACYSAPRRDTAIASVPAGQAQVVFFRPTKTLQDVSVYLLDADQQQPQFLGLVSPDTKLAAVVSPGDHLFMVVGDQEAEFMNAHLEADKTYYALARGRYDKSSDWHFFLLPIHRSSADAYNIHAAAFRKWLRACHLVEPPSYADQWYAENRSRVENLRARYINRWNQRSDESRAQLTLNAEDGVVILQPGMHQERSKPAGTAEQAESDSR